MSMREVLREARDLLDDLLSGVPHQEQYRATTILNKLDAALRELDRVAAALRELEADAERYRHLKSIALPHYAWDRHEGAMWHMSVHDPKDKGLNAAIDAARKP